MPRSSLRLACLTTLLTLALAACSGGSGGNNNPPNTDLDTFFQSQPTFSGSLPAGTQTTTPEEFMKLVKAGAKVMTAADLQAAQDAEKQQKTLDETDAQKYVEQYPEFKNILDNTPAANIEHLVTVDTDGGPKTVTLMGNLFGRSVLATHARTFATRENQAKVYANLYPDLQQALTQLNYSPERFNLPTPEQTAGYSVPALLEANGRLADLAQEFRGDLSNLKVVLPPANGETGSASQLDRSQAGACKAAATGGIYKNFDWPLKGLTTSVKDQGQRGTCWGFATVAALEAEIARRDHKLVNLSEQDYVGHRFLDWAFRAYGDGGDPVYIAQKASVANYVFPYESGWQYNKSNSRIANDSAQTYSNSCSGYSVGVCSDTNYQGYALTVSYLNKSTGKTSTFLLRGLPNTGSSSGYRMQTPSDFWDQANLDRSMVILLLRSVLGHSTTITLDMRYVKPTANAAPSLNNMNPDRNGFVPNQTMKKLANGNLDWELDHVMTVTGFISSKNIRQVLPNQPVADDYGYFIVKNSWGDCWGDQGYLYLPWTWIKTFVGEASTGIAPQ